MVVEVEVAHMEVVEVGMEVGEVEVAHRVEEVHKVEVVLEQAVEAEQGLVA
jgi:hypothetical protein